MEYPKRVEQHISESQSFKTLNASLPAPWIVREVGGTDYGIDCYIEIVGDDRLLKGDMVSIQVKAISGIVWTKSDYYTFSSVKMSTSNYWNGLPIPVFLFVADINSNELFFLPVKSYIRKNFASYKEQKGFSYRIEKYNKVTALNVGSFLEAYRHEKHLADLETQVISFLSNLGKYKEYGRQYHSRDPFLGLENSRIIFLKAYYENLHRLCSYFDVSWDLKKFVEYETESMKMFGDEYYSLHEKINDKIIDGLEAKFAPLLIKIRHLITEEEKDYWLSKDYHLFTEADQIGDDGSYDGYWD